jgi:hypothetical protein
MDPLEDLLVEIEAGPGLPEEASVVQRIRCSIQDGAALPVPEWEQDVMWEELHLLAIECCSRKRARFERIQAFQGLWHRELQAEHARKELGQLVAMSATTGASGGSGRA